jgi:sulfotransferase family protein
MPAASCSAGRSIMTPEPISSRSTGSSPCTRDTGWTTRHQGHAAAAPVFVAGLPRTGTTLVERIIASHPMMATVGETGAFAIELRRSVQENPSGRDVAGLGQHYLDAVCGFGAKPDARFVDKTLQNYLHCRLIHAALPKAKIILLQRHPLDACWAIYKAHFQGIFPFAYQQIELAEFYLAYRRLTRHWRAILPSDVLLEINYEDIVRDQMAASRRLIDFVGLPWDQEVLRFHERSYAAGKSAPIGVSDSLT